MVRVLPVILLNYERTCAKKAVVVGLARPNEAPGHRVVAEGFANALRAHVLQHLLLGHLAAPELNKKVLRIAARALHQFHAHLRTNGRSLSHTALGVAVGPKGGAVHRVVEHPRNVFHGLAVV